MAVEVIKPGDRNRQGNAYCPQCGEVVLIKHHWGDPPKCRKCGASYILKLETPKYQ